MVKILGLADCMASAIFFANVLRADIPVTMMLFFALYLIIKGGIFILNSFDAGSALDVAGGIILILLIFFSMPSAVLISFGAFLMLKGGASLLSA